MIDQEKLQEAWNIVAEALAETNSITFFVGPDFEHDRNCFQLYDVDECINIVSKPVRNRREEE